MQELEKILEEIARLKEMYKTSAFSLLDKGNLPCEYDKSDIESAKAQALSEAIAIIRKHMNDGWISVERELPKTNGTYNVTRYIDGHFISDSAYFDGQNTWHSDNRVNHSRPYLTDVIAWMPRPEPYRPERSDNYDGE